MSGRNRARLGVFAPVALIALVAIAAVADTVTTPYNALWVARSGGLTQVSTDDAQPVRAIEIGADARAVAVDEALGSVWAFSEDRLHAFGPDGTRWLDASVVGPKGIAPVDLLVDTSAGVVWLAAGKDLYRYSTSGSFLGKLSSKLSIDALAWDSARDQLWVASKQTLTVYSAAGALIRAQDLGAGVVMRDAAFDAHLDAIWVSTQSQLLRFGADGTPQLAVALASGSPVRSLHPDLDGGLWAHDAGTLVHLDAYGAITRTIVVFPAETEDERIVDATFDPAHGTLWIGSKRFLREYGMDGALRQELVLSTGGPFRIFRLTAFGDREAPSIVITAPTDGAILDDSQPTISLAFLDGGAGIDLASLAATFDGAAIALACTGDDESATCEFPSPLADGEHTLAVTVADLAGNRSAPATVAFTVDTTALVLTVVSPSDGLYTSQSLVTVRGSVSKPATVRINGALAQVSSELEFDANIALVEGANAIEVTALDAFGRTASVERTVNRDSVAPAPVSAGGISISLPIDGLVTVSGGPGSAEPGSTVRILNTRTGDAVTAPVAADGSFSAVIAAERRDALALVVIDAAGNESTSNPVTVPGDIAPPTLSILSPTADAFLGTGNPIVQIAHADDDSGVDPASLLATVNGTPVALACDAQPALATCTLSAPLTEGEHLLAVTLADVSGNRSAAVEQRFTVDLTPPIVTLTGPTSPTQHAARTLTGTVSEPATLLLGNQAFVHDAALGFSAPVTLTEGDNEFRVVATDRAGNQGEATRVVVLDTVAPALTLTAPIDGLQTNQLSVTAEGEVDSLATVEVNGASVTLDSQYRFATTVELLEGGNIVLVSATDAAGNSVQLTRTVVRDTALPLPPDLGLIQVSHAIDGVANVTGGAGSVEGGSTVRVRNLRTGQVVTVTANADGSFSAAVGAQPGDPLQIQVLDSSGNASETRDTSVTNLPPDPSLIAPPLAKDHATLMHEAVSFLYSGPNAIQTGVVPGTIDPVFVAVLRGRVIARDGASLTGVIVSVKGHPEFGQTLTRADGMFDLAVNGGGSLVVEYRKPDHLPAQRIIAPPQQDFGWLPEVALLPLDPVVSLVDLESPAPFQVARGSTMTDDDGARQLTAVFPQGTTATMTRLDGVIVSLATLNLRVTEYTVGATGPAAMPAPLPATSAYTYAVAVTADEVLSGGKMVGGHELRFNQPIQLYVDNFLDFPSGTIVPVGYYDPDAALWRSNPDGIVIDILSEAAGLAILDTNGDGQADNAARYAELGIADAERGRIAALYEPGQSLWRAQTDHLSWLDLNMPLGTDAPVKDPNAAEADQNPKDPQDGSTECGSIISCETQVLAEQVAITGAPFIATYSSDRVPGRRVAYRHEIKLTDETGVPGASAVQLEVIVAGRLFKREFLVSDGQIGQAPFSNLTHIFEWDGLDAYSRPMVGPQPIQVRIGYQYGLRYMSGSAGSSSGGPSVCVWGPCPSGGGSFGSPSDSSPGVFLSEVRDGDQGIVWRDIPGVIGTIDSRSSGLGGWSLDGHHVYVPRAQRLYTGDGETRNLAAQVGLLEAHAGAGCASSAFPSGNAKTACFTPTDLAVGSKGEVYFTASGSTTVLRTLGVIERGGTIRALALLPEAIKDLRFGKDGRLYVTTAASNPWGNSIYRVATDGSFERVLGNGANPASTTGTTSYPTVGASATGTSFSVYAFDVADDGTMFVVNKTTSNSARLYRVVPGGIVTFLFQASSATAALQSVAFAPDGSLVVAGGSTSSGGGGQIKRYRPDGSFVHLAGGNQQIGGTGDGGLATAAGFSSPKRLALARSGDIFLIENGGFSGTRIRRIGGDALVNGVAGGGAETWTEALGGPAVNVELVDGTTDTTGTAYDIDPISGTVYIASPGARRIFAVKQALPPYEGQLINIASADGSELYEFDSTGKHLRTRDTMTGATRLAFGYDTLGFLTTVTDLDGDITTIEHDGLGQPTTIIAADGQRTALAVNGEGFISAITSPANETHGITYLPGGLLASFTPPKGNGSTMTYTPDGLLLTDLNAGEGGWTLGFTRTEAGSISTMTTAEGRTKRFETTTDPTGSMLQTITALDGSVSTRHSGSNYRTVSTSADGTVMTSTQRQDPRFKMQASIPASTTVTLPSGLESTVTQARSAVLSDSTNPMSLTTQTDSVTVNGKTTRTVYTAASRTYTTTSAANRVSTVQVDAKGKPILSQLTGLAAAANTYDARGRLSTVTVGTGAGARMTSFTYHASGHQAGWLATVTDAEQRTVAFAYDPAGRVTTQTLPDQRVIGYRYDANSNLVGLTPPGKPEHAFAYTAVDLEGEYTPPDVNSGSDATDYGYDRDKLLRSITRPDGAGIGFEYGTDGKLDTLTMATGITSYGYHPTSGQLASVSAPGGESLGYAYDGFLLTQVQSTGSVSGTVGFGFDNEFRVTSLAVNGSAVTFAYDLDSLLTRAGDLTITRNAQHGLITGTTLGSNTSTQSYNGFGELSVHEARYAGAVVFREEITGRDKLGRITTKVETVQGVSRSFQYGYDLAGRLETVDRDGVRISTYGYDSNGNRLSRNGVVGTYDTQDRMLSYSGASFVYTANGELDTRTENGQIADFDYDLLGNLRRVALPSGQVLEYAIDGQNRRIGKRVNGTLVQGFLYQDQLEPVAELDGSGAVVARFVYGTKAHVPDYLVKGGITYRIVSDYLGSVRLVVNTADGTVAQRMSYDEFGVVTEDTNPGFQPFGYAGGIYDSDTGLIRFGARDYDPVSGRWLAQDPNKFDGRQSNLLIYAGAEPINRFDVNGRNWSSVFNWAAKQVQRAVKSEGKSSGTDAIMREAIETSLAEQYERDVSEGMDQMDAIQKYSDQMKELHSLDLELGSPFPTSDVNRIALEGIADDLLAPVRDAASKVCPSSFAPCPICAL